MRLFVDADTDPADGNAESPVPPPDVSKTPAETSVIDALRVFAALASVTVTVFDPAPMFVAIPHWLYMFATVEAPALV